MKILQQVFMRGQNTILRSVMLATSVPPSKRYRGCISKIEPF